MTVRYETLEKLQTAAPVDRLSYIQHECRGKRVLDIGCYDETSLVKRDTEHWLHGRIAAVADSVLGVDSSSGIPDEGITTGPRSRIIRGDATTLSPSLMEKPFDVVVAGELIEHIDNPIAFIRSLRSLFPEALLLASTPNGGALSNALMGIIGREAQHPDHVHVFTYKILNTICSRSGLSDWEIIPYHFYATEMILTSRGVKKSVAKIAERVIRTLERAVPLLSVGYIIRAKL